MSAPLQPHQFVQRPLPGVEGTTVVSGDSGPIPVGPVEDTVIRSDRTGAISRVKYPTQYGWSSENPHQRARRQSLMEGNRRRNNILDSGQRAMFMTPHEIHDRYQPLDGDRIEYFRLDGGDTTEDDDDLWNRKLDESQMPQRTLQTVRGVDPTGTDTYIDRLDPTTGYPDWKTGHTDTFDQEAESWVNQKVGEWKETRDETLYDSIKREGVKAPVHLSESRGDEGLPMVVGGHHRLAAQTDLDRDRLMPVLHHRDITDAKLSPAYKYT